MMDIHTKSKFKKVHRERYWFWCVKSIFWQRNSSFLAVWRWHVGKTLSSPVVAAIVRPRGHSVAKKVIQRVPQMGFGGSSCVVGHDRSWNRNIRSRSGRCGGHECLRHCSVEI